MSDTAQIAWILVIDFTILIFLLGRQFGRVNDRLDRIEEHLGKETISKSEKDMIRKIQ